MIKKIVRKLKTLYSGYISSQSGPGKIEKVLRKNSFRVVFLPDSGWSIPKKTQKN